MRQDGLLEIIGRLQKQVAELREGMPQPPRWATVTSASPLRIRMDQATQPLNLTPENLAGPLSVGDRVIAQYIGQRVLVWGTTSHRITAEIRPTGGFAPQSGFTPTVMKEGGRVFMEGGWNSAGMAPATLHDVGMMPQWAWPSRATYFLAVSNSATTTPGARCVVYPDGRVQIRPGSTLGTYYLHEGVSWPAP